MKALFQLIPLLILLSCAKIEDYDSNMLDSQSTNSIEAVSLLVFDSNESLAEEIAKTSNETKTRSTVDGAFMSLFTTLKNYDYEKDPILSYEISQIVEDELDPEKSIYRLLGYNELVPNEDFARLLNVRGEFCVGDTIYKVSPKGTYYFPLSMRSFFEHNYAKLEGIIGEEIEKSTFRVAEDIYRYNTFSVDENSINSDYIRTKASDLPVFNWSDYPTHTGDVLDNVVFTYTMPDKKRMKTRVYHHNYVAYQERGAYVKVQKKAIVWSDIDSAILNITWRNLLFKANYGASFQEPFGNNITIEATGNDYQWMGQSLSYIIIRNYIIPSTQFANYVKWARGSFDNFINSATGIDVSTYAVVILKGPDYMQIAIPGMKINEGFNTEELKRQFNHQWFSSVPEPIAGQFSYAAVNDLDFGAMRVGTAF